MEEMIMKPPQSRYQSSFSLKPAMHKDSRLISKSKPTIRIIHIFAPEIIKTDVANFRELVQRLTGKPSDQKGSRKKKIINTRSVHGKALNSFYLHKPSAAAAAAMEMRHEFPCSLLDAGEKIKVEEEEEERWNISGKSENFLNGFTELDDFIQELVGYPLLPF